MTDEERTRSILRETEYNYISFDNLHGDGQQGLKIITGALKKQLRKEVAWLKIERWTIPTCPNCEKGLSYRQNCCDACGQAIKWKE